ncbi:helix-turn-helix domain-containing protein [Limibacillus halophilus]|uniref:Transcriptional regulator with XRE-family HTH domain n=1 Tax=Limibacillus halophilus TaxID=1579333 RepID=A0A839SVL5_9PROT|nr:helix-turn-helix transcriptional regulator [Limibacillus halophilus]MBB3065720.1 transcriptional regulator with XRE-family HTH domain [Limibacillus halophilus]
MADKYDVAIGKRLRQLRTDRGLTQTQLGELLDVSFQQIQKYEKGTNRIGSGRLWVISRLLKSPIGYFFEDLDEPGSESEAEPVGDGRLSRDSVLLARSLNELPDGEIKVQLTKLVKAISRCQTQLED